MLYYDTSQGESIIKTVNVNVNVTCVSRTNGDVESSQKEATKWVNDDAWKVF